MARSTSLALVPCRKSVLCASCGAIEPQELGSSSPKTAGSSMQLETCKTCHYFYHKGMCKDKHDHLCNAYAICSRLKKHEEANPELVHLAQMVYILAILSRNVLVNDQLNYLVSHIESFDKPRLALINKVIGYIDVPKDGKLLPKTDNLLKLACVHAVNSFTWQDCHLSRLGVAFDLIVSLINHSCVPNCHAYIDAKGQTIIRAVRHIFPDEPITLSYTQPFQSFEDRTVVLKHYFFFTCVCPVCTGRSALPTDCWNCCNCDKLVPLDTRCSTCSKLVARKTVEHINRDAKEMLEAASFQLESDIDTALELCRKTLHILDSCSAIPLGTETYHLALQTLETIYVSMEQLDYAFVTSFVNAQCAIQAESFNITASPLVCASFMDLLYIGVRLLADAAAMVRESKFLRSVLTLCHKVYDFLNLYSANLYDGELLPTCQDCGHGIEQLYALVPETDKIPLGAALVRISEQFAKHHQLSQQYSTREFHALLTSM